MRDSGRRPGFTDLLQHHSDELVVEVQPGGFQLRDDPDSDPQYLKADGTVDEEAAGIKRADLFNLIEELVMWENSNNADVIRTARAEIARCVASRLIETGALARDFRLPIFDFGLSRISIENQKSKIKNRG